MFTALLAFLTLTVTLAFALLAGADVLLLRSGAEGVDVALAGLSAILFAFIVPLVIAARVRRRWKPVRAARATLITTLSLNLAQLSVLALVFGPSTSEALTQHGDWAAPKPAKPMVKAAFQALDRAVASRRRSPTAPATTTVAPSNTEPVTAITASPELSMTFETASEPPPTVVVPTEPRRLDARALFAARADSVLLIEVQTEHSLLDFEGRVTKTKGSGLERKFWQRSRGSGFFVSADGLFVTNHHVLGRAGRATVVLRDGRRISGVEVLARAAKDDLVLARVALTETSSAPIGQREVAIGEPAFAIGSPRGLNFTLTSGIVSADRDVHGTKFWQMQTDIAPGSSGGPLFDEYGEVIGVNTMSRDAGLNLAVQSRHVGALLELPRSAQVLAPVKDAISVASVHVDGGAAGPNEREQLAHLAAYVGYYLEDCVKLVPNQAQIEITARPFTVSSNLHPHDQKCLERARELRDITDYLIGVASGGDQAGALRVEINYEGMRAKQSDETPGQNLRLVLERPEPTASP